uniref:TH1 domain-containing protein n=1 Tax=Caenorhabditis tropicalis TaxID=1561998 RepID=A0A1I7T4N8_9PELO
MSRSVALVVADRLNKYIDLPPRPKFKVNDVLQRGNVFSFVRSKSTFFAFPDEISSLKNRFINVTSTGFMIIYETNQKGIVVDLRRALNVFCEADRFVKKSKKINYLRCHVKIRLPRGNIHLFLRDENVHKWTCAIMRASARPGKLVSPVPSIPLETMETHLETAIEEEEEEEEISTACESCAEPVTVIEVPNSSVRSLRLKLEKELVLMPKEQFFAEVYHPPTNEIVLEPTSEQEKKEEEAEVEREKNWWMRSLRC